MLCGCPTGMSASCSGGSARSSGSVKKGSGTGVRALLAVSTHYMILLVDRRPEGW